MRPWAPTQSAFSSIGQARALQPAAPTSSSVVGWSNLSPSNIRVGPVSLATATVPRSVLQINLMMDFPAATNPARKAPDSSKLGCM